MYQYPITLVDDSEDEGNEHNDQVEVYRNSKAQSIRLASEINAVTPVTSYLSDPESQRSLKTSTSLISKLGKQNIEKMETVQPFEISKRKKKIERKKEKEKTKGPEWFNLPATELTEEKKNDLEIIQMRSVLDPKRFYKKNDMKNLPKYFQVGTIVDSAAEFYSDRVPKKQRKKTLVDELMADANFQRYNKKKFVEIQERKQRLTGFHKHAKRLKKNK